MSIGNLKSEGNKSNNFPWQLKMLLGQQCACDQLTTLVDQTDDVEFLLSAILTTLQASTEYEAKFVVDTCNGDTVYLEVRVWNPDDSTWGPITYYLPGSATPVVPPGAATPGCLVYADPSAVLALILGAIQAGNLILTDIETNTGDTVTELQSLLALYTAGQSACASSLSVTLCTEQGTSLSNIETNTTGLATEVTLGLLEAKDFATETTLLSVDSNAAQLVTNTTSATRTPNLIRPSGIFGNTPVGTYSVSFASVGTANATVGGMILKPGETVNFDGGAVNNTVGVIAYDTTLAGAELIITYLI
jgi:hypothetical protein